MNCLWVLYLSSKAARRDEKSSSVLIPQRHSVSHCPPNGDTVATLCSQYEILWVIIVSRTGLGLEGGDGSVCCPREHFSCECFLQHKVFTPGLVLVFPVSFSVGAPSFKHLIDCWWHGVAGQQCGCVVLVVLRGDCPAWYQQSRAFPVVTP